MSPTKYTKTIDILIIKFVSFYQLHNHHITPLHHIFVGKCVQYPHILLEIGECTAMKDIRVGGESLEEDHSI